VGTAHGVSLESLLKNPELNPLVSAGAASNGCRQRGNLCGGHACIASAATKRLLWLEFKEQLP